MKTITHNQQDSTVNILKYKDSVLSGTFFKVKPVAGDCIRSFAHGCIRILEVLEVKNAKVCSTCSYDPVDAYFVLRCETISLEELDQLIKLNSEQK
jgi:hypothetical protein